MSINIEVSYYNLINLTCGCHTTKDQTNNLRTSTCDVYLEANKKGYNAQV